jgi:hypothetical protein
VSLSEKIKGLIERTECLDSDEVQAILLGTLEIISALEQKTRQLEIPDELFRLCYVSEDFTAFFTTQELSKQWGDDWNDAPYEHNAGTPYEPSKATEHWELREIKFSGNFLLPCTDLANSGWSVQQINEGAFPWLRTANSSHALMAGATILDFYMFLWRHDGKVLGEAQP